MDVSFSSHAKKSIMMPWAQIPEQVKMILFQILSLGKFMSDVTVKVYVFVYLLIQTRFDGWL